MGRGLGSNQDPDMEDQFQNPSALRNTTPLEGACLPQNDMLVKADCRDYKTGSLSPLGLP